MPLLPLFPVWLRAYVKKYTSSAFCIRIIRNHLKCHYYYDDAEAPLLVSLLKMIDKRSWAGKDGDVSRSSLINAVDGLSPFLMIDFSEDEIAELNDLDYSMLTASHVTPTYIQKLKAKLKADEVVLLLKRYRNIVYALFGGLCTF